jgi:hypothetical protein
MRDGNGVGVRAVVILPFVERVAKVRKFHKPLAKSVVLGAYSCGNS